MLKTKLTVLAFFVFSLTFAQYTANPKLSTLLVLILKKME